MTPSTGPDLAALREKAEAVIEHPSAATVREWWDERENLSAESLLVVLSLVDGLRAENRLLREEVRLREESQIPMIPRAAQKTLERAEAENERLRGSLKAIAMYHPCRNLSFVQAVVENALAGSPAANEEQQ